MARLTTAERNALPSSDFADPAHRRFPMEDADHREAAEMDAHSSHDKAMVHAKLARSKLGRVKA